MISPGLAIVSLLLALGDVRAEEPSTPETRVWEGRSLDVHPLRVRYRAGFDYERKLVVISVPTLEYVADGSTEVTHVDFFLLDSHRDLAYTVTFERFEIFVGRSDSSRWPPADAKPLDRAPPAIYAMPGQVNDYGWPRPYEHAGMWGCRVLPEPGVGEGPITLETPPEVPPRYAFALRIPLRPVEIVQPARSTVWITAHLQIDGAPFEYTASFPMQEVKKRNAIGYGSSPPALQANEARWQECMWSWHPPDGSNPGQSVVLRRVGNAPPEAPAEDGSDGVP